MINSRLFLVGNVGKIESEYTPTAKFICKGTFAVNIGFGDKKETNWYNFIVWDKQGELFNELVGVGTHLLIEGELLLREWTDKDGGKHISHDVTVRDFNVLGRGKKKEQTEFDSPE